MDRVFKIRQGEISFSEDRLIIEDDSKKQYRLAIFSSIMWTVYGFFSVLRSYRTGDDFLLWTGWIIGVAHAVILILHLWRSHASDIAYSDIKSMYIKERFGNKFLDIKLTNNRIRRVKGISESLDLSECMRSIENGDYANA